MADHYYEFPYEEIRRPNGDYFDTALEAEKAGFQRNQIWSVVEIDGNFIYGPPHHFVNRIGFIATKETHDFDTYYHDETNPDDYK